MRRQPATMQVVNGEAAPAPVIFQFVESVLGIDPVAVGLGNCEYFIAEIGHHYRVLATSDACHLFDWLR